MCPSVSRRRNIQLLVFCAALVVPSGEVHANDDIYTPGGDVRPPKLIHYVEPEFNSDSKEAFVEGTVKISTVVTLEGEPADCHIVASLTSGQDKRAMEAVKQWRFQPGTKSGKPVRVKVTVEVGFHLL